MNAVVINFTVERKRMLTRLSKESMASGQEVVCLGPEPRPFDHSCGLETVLLTILSSKCFCGMLLNVLVERENIKQRQDTCMFLSLGYVCFSGCVSFSLVLGSFIWIYYASLEVILLHRMNISWLQHASFLLSCWLSQCHNITTIECWCKIISSENDWKILIILKSFILFFMLT